MMNWHKGTTEVIDSDKDWGEPVVKFVNQVLVDAIRKRVSDIHFEPYEKRYRVRFRLDGNLLEAASPPLNMSAALASRIKIMCKMDIAEEAASGWPIESANGEGSRDGFSGECPSDSLGREKWFFDSLDKSNLQLDMTKLGFEEDDLALFKANINLPQGMVLITGPTGSGKTTTIYFLALFLN